METGTFWEALIIGFLTFTLLADDRSAVRRKLPCLKIKRIQLFPAIRIYTSRRFVHFHHWFVFSLILVTSLFITGGLLGYIFTKGFLLGGVIQGLSLKNQKTSKGLVHKRYAQQQTDSLQLNMADSQFNFNYKGKN